MRFLTFQIGGHRLAVPAESVASVGKPYRKEKVRPVDIRRRLGAGPSADEGQPVITCRHRRSLLEFPVDRVLNLEEYLSDQLGPWPAVLSFNRLFKGVAELDGALFFLLDLEAATGEAGRAKR